MVSVSGRSTTGHIRMSGRRLAEFGWPYNPIYDKMYAHGRYPRD